MRRWLIVLIFALTTFSSAMPVSLAHASNFFDFINQSSEWDGEDRLRITTTSGGWGLADSYEVNVDRAGRLEFTGRSLRLGRDTKVKVLTPSAFDDIAKEIVDLKAYMAAGVKCPFQISDQPSVNLTLYKESDLMEVYVYRGCINQVIDSHLKAIHAILDLSDLVELVNDPLR